MVAHLGFEAATAWVQANNETAPLAVRVQSRRSNRDAVAAALRARGLEVTPHPDLSQNLSVRRSGKVTNLPGFQNGDFTVQDPAATLVGLFADPQPGQLVLDTCAAPGGKATHLAELMGETGTVVAMDVHPGKARLVAAAAQRLHLTNIVPAVGDATDFAALQAALKTATAGRRLHADIVVVDAPCSGMGTLRRNPELRRGGPERVVALAALQAQILANAAQCVAPGGHLVYAVCTVTPEEGPEQVAAFGAAHPEFCLVPPPAKLAPFAEGNILRTWTHRHAMDSFFCAKWVRLPSA
jgi:16S rRNA (cytosine967-C5)-methyltransferase